MTALGVLAFVVGLLVSIMLHEAGHLITAKRSGMKVTEFFVGFGPKLFSWRRGETEYGAKAVPAGGYCKIIGMHSEEDVADEDAHRAFYRQPGWQRAIVLASGSFTHFVLAFFLLLVIAVGIGFPQESKPTLTVGKVASCVPAAPGKSCTPDRPRSPAALSGLQPGDTIVAFAGEPVDGWNEFAKAVSSHGPGTVQLTVLRDGHRKTLRVDLASLGGGGYLGIYPKADVVTERLGPLAAVQYAGEKFAFIMVKTAQAFAAIPSAIPNLFSEDRGEGQGGSVGSVVAVAQMSANFFSDLSDWQIRILGFLSLMVSLNISVGMLNLLPIFPLDGSHLAVLGYERARAGIARLRGLADPGPVDINKLMPIASVMLVLVVGFGVLLILADIFNPLV